MTSIWLVYHDRREGMRMNSARSGMRCALSSHRTRSRVPSPWRAHRAKEKRSCLVWWPRIWTRNTVEPKRT